MHGTELVSTLAALAVVRHWKAVYWETRTHRLGRGGRKRTGLRHLGGRLLYFLLGFIGPRAEAEEIKVRLREFLRDDLRLELSEDKTLITHATDDVAHFLGYDVRSNHADDYLCPDGRRNVNGIIELRVPTTVITRKRAAYMRGGKPIHRPELAHESDYSIMTRYQQEYRGVVQYYLLAHNVASLSYVCYTMHVSLLKTLACKHRAKAVAMARRYRSTVETEHGPLKCLKVVVPRGDDKKPLVALFGGIPLRRKETALLRDTLPNVRFLTQQTDRLRQDSERNQAVGRVNVLVVDLTSPYAAWSTAHTSPQRSWNKRRCSAKETVSFRCWRERRWSRSSSWAEQKRAAASKEPKPRMG